MLSKQPFCCCCSAAKSYPTLCDLMDCSTSGSFVSIITQFAQTHVHWVSDAIQPSNPLPTPSPFAFSLSQHQYLFLELTLCIRWPKYWSFSFSNSCSSNIQGWFPLGLTGLITLQSKGLSRVFSRNSHKKSKFWLFNLLAMRLYQ